jgi:DNA-binding LacI/PurR family transcriptional regulator
MRNKNRKQTFLLVIPSFEDIFHSFYAGEIIKGVSLAASRLNMDILIHITDRFDHKSWLNASLLDADDIDGIIFADIDKDLSIVKKVISRNIPYIVLNNYLEQPINCLAIDNHAATFKIVEHLTKLGHERIATIAGDQMTQSGQSRLEAFKEALDAKGIETPKSYIAFGDFLRTPARAAATKLLNLKDRPTAIFAASDVMAMELIDVAVANNIRVPEDLSVVGFDDNPLNINCPIRLTTVFQPLVEMGRLGAEHLKEIVSGKAKLPVKGLLAAKFVPRNSTGPCMASDPATTTKNLK